MIFSAVIFDMDGLMFDTERIAQQAWVRAAGDFGYVYPDQVYQGVIGRARPDVERYSMEAFGAEFPFEVVYRAKGRYMLEALESDGIPLKPGLLDLLAWLEARSIPAAVASSSPRAAVLRNLKLAGLEPERFGALVGGDEVPHGKPAPDIFLEVARRLEIPPEKCLVLEDSNAGIKAAHAAGMHPVMVPDLKPPTDEAHALAYRIVDSLAGVQAILEGQD
jgi:HAD superfamily hydrolase (TIGR01509 family)